MHDVIYPERTTQYKMSEVEIFQTDMSTNGMMRVSLCQNIIIIIIFKCSTHTSTIHEEIMRWRISLVGNYQVIEPVKG